MGGAYNLKLLAALSALVLLLAASRPFLPGLLEAALRAPVLPRDLLPLLPWPVAQPLLRRLALRGAADLLPSFVGVAREPDDGGARAAEWKGACFYDNRAWMEFHNGTDGGLGGGTLHLEVSAGPKPRVPVLALLL